MAYYRVESFHINVGAGDAAIHLLTSQPEQGRWERTVKCAYLVDGGKHFSYRPKETIHSTINEIEATYWCQGKGQDVNALGRPLLKFDGFVVTHWDSDHYQGVIGLLLEDHVKACFFEPIDDRLKLKRAHYDQDAADVRPKSWLYAPNLDKNFNVRGVFWDNGTVVIKSRTLDPATGQYTRERVARNQLKIRTGTDQLLGRNLFNLNQDGPFSNRWPNMTTPQALLGNNAPVNQPDLNYDPIPGLYCVAVQQQMLGNNPQIHYTESNMSSIVLVVLWSTGHITHYFGGDAHDLNEILIAAWADRPSTSMKLSHHGAATSNPYQMIIQFDPLNIVASAGTQYGHPRWELLLILDSWFRQRNANGQNGDRRTPFLSTQYPSYLIMDEFGEYDPAGWAIDEIGQTRLRKWIEDRECDYRVNRTMVEETPLEAYDFWLRAQTNPSEWAKRRQICTIIAALMRTLSPMNINMTRPLWQDVDVENDGDAIQIMNEDGNESIVCVKVVSSPGDDNGEVFILFKTHQPYSQLVPPIRWQSPHAPTLLRALWASNIEEPLVITRYVNTGEDSPGFRDLTKRSTRPTSLKTKAVKAGGTGHRRLGSWVDVDTTGSDSDDSWLDIQVQDAVPPIRHQPFAVSYRDIPVYTEAPAVYIIAESLGKKTFFPTGTLVQTLRQTHPFFGVVDTLHFRLFSLSAIPVEKEPVPLAGDDELLGWFQLFLTWRYQAGSSPEALDMTMTPSAWPIEGNDEAQLHFTLKFPFVNGEELVMSTDAGAISAFHSVGVGASSLQQMLVKRRTMVFGLEALGSGEKTLETILGHIASLLMINLEDRPVFKFFRNKSLTLDMTKDFRNALWFRPGVDYETKLRLQFRADITLLNDWLADPLPGVQITEVLVIARKKAKYVFNDKAQEIEPKGHLTFLVRVKIAELNFNMAISINKDTAGLTMTLVEPDTESEMRTLQEDGLKHLVKWLSQALGGESLDVMERIEKATKKENGSGDQAAVDGSSVYPRRLQLSLQLKPDGSVESIKGASLEVEVCLNIGKPPVAALENEPLLFLLDFGWGKDRGVYFKGRLWCVAPETPFDEYTKALPGWEEFVPLKPLTKPSKENPLRTLDIRRLTPGGLLSNIPAWVPTEIYRAEVKISKEAISFGGAIRCPAPKPDEIDKKAPPPITLDNVELVAKYAWGVKTPDDGRFELGLEVDVSLFLGGSLDPDKDVPEQMQRMARLRGAFEYKKGNWELTAGVYNLKIAHLIPFWHKEDQKDVLDFMSDIEIESAELTYQFEKGTGKTFKFVGQIGLGQVLKLGMTYENSGAENWLFQGYMDAKKEDTTCTIGDVLKSFIQPDKIVGIPGPISSAQLRGERGDKPFRLLCAKHKGMGVFAILVNIGSITLWFVQFRPVGKDGKPGVMKRFVKAAISKVSVEAPAFSTTINSPFEQLFWLWVQDNTGSSTALGISSGEFDALKECLMEKAELREDDFLMFKSNKEKPVGPGAADVDKSEIVISVGQHLVAVAKDTDGKAGVVLDYAFAKPRDKKKTKAIMGGQEAGQDQAPDPSGADKGTKSPMKKQLGPLSIENVGLWYKTSEEDGGGLLGITLDASLVMGPVGLELLGFSIGVPFDKGYSLSNMPPIDQIQLSLDGMVVSLDRPPLTVAGGFLHDTSDPDVDLYAGGLIVGFKPWMFQAMGVYATVTKDTLTNAVSVSLDPLGHLELFRNKPIEDKKKFTFAFIFCQLNGPLFSVGFADFAGLVGGFGMNSDISLPTVEQVFDFPFVQERGSDNEETTVAKMQRLMRGIWFRPAEGLYWAAAGVRITAFQMLAANVVIVVQFGAGLELGLFGVATCDVPALDAPVRFAHVELGIVCAVDVNGGVFKLEAQLSPRSFVLAPQCHLTGGLAMYAWFKDNDKGAKAGDWVLTLGGYHQAFRAPTQYPKPPRLSISWSLDESLSVTGEAYFAITPRICMGGGRLHAALSLGALYAWFDAFLDFLINFEPFYFQLQSRISVGVRFTMDVWFVTMRINAEVNASLDLSGPPFGGVVHVDFWVFGFDVKFGSPTPRPPPVTLERFWAVVLKSSGGSSSLLQGPSASSSKADTAPILLTCESGLEPQSASPRTSEECTEDNQIWMVKGGSFSFLVTFQFAINQAFLTDAPDNREPKTQPVKNIKKEHERVFARPMQLTTKLTSKATITVTSTVPVNAEDMFHVAEEDAWKAMKWRIEPIVKSVQTSIWGIYDPEQDPYIKGNRVSELLEGDKTSTDLVMGLSVRPPAPGLARDWVNKFDVVQDRLRNAIDRTEEPIRRPFFPDNSVEADKGWLPNGRETDWEKVENIWRSSGNANATKTVDIWAKRLGWKTKKEVGNDGEGHDNDKPKPIVGRPPLKLLDRFEQMVPALPLVAVGGVTR